LSGFADKQGVRGTLLLRCFDRGREVWRFHDPNVVVNGGRQTMSLMLAGQNPHGAITRISVGNNPALPQQTDSAISNQYAKAFDSITFPSSTGVSFNFSLTDNELVGYYVAEFGLLLADGTLFSRKTVPSPANKSATQSFAGSWTINF
jgi:hypothetical protein